MVLVALLVLSVMAVPALAAGGVAAQQDDADAELWISVDAPEEVDGGDAFEVTVDVENRGPNAFESEIDLALTVDGEEVDTATLGSLDADSTETLTLSAATDDYEGDVDWTVTTDGEDADNGTVAVNWPDEDTDTDDDDGSSDTDDGDSDDSGSDDDSDDGGDGISGFGVAVAVTALLGAALLALRRDDQ